MTAPNAVQLSAAGPAEPEAPGEGDAGRNLFAVALAWRFGLRLTRTPPHFTSGNRKITQA